MDFNQFNKWIELTKQQQQEQFWSQFSSFNSSSDFNQQSFFTKQEVFPRCDFYEDKEGMTLEIEVPGLKKEHIQITLQDQTLIIKGEAKTLKPQVHYFLKERANLRFEKKITIPIPFDPNTIHYYFESGLMVISIPKKTGGEAKIHIDESS
ncbi:Hsp20/alpha crystallin family protein [Bacillus sp. 31A1R]|uniref:Hsp20/alpha crystallin family protein n=1 Tax=Robertmurraya mangrovi TaxID=3098077 RepID=A0ABU5J5I0_9BACI|nr:Hsp20/alpha crystallin family protein [Bacillus sp. 31A1R]MDZ5474632.1 Hsp20/alpha crystallin family protein [Bacillus sp. 31A1R]